MCAYGGGTETGVGGVAREHEQSQGHGWGTTSSVSCPGSYPKTLRPLRVCTESLPKKGPNWAMVRVAILFEATGHLSGWCDL